jgi:antitoxin HicB
MKKVSNPHRGSTLDSFLHEQGIYPQVTTAAVLEVFAEEAKEEMRRRNLSQLGVARKMKSSRAVLSRLFTPKPSSVSVSTLVRIADALDKDIRIELVNRVQPREPNSRQKIKQIDKAAMLTTSAAAEMLNVSRPFLIKLVKKENVQRPLVGNRRRIPYEEVIRLKQLLQTTSDKVMSEMAELEKKFGLPD